MTEKKADVKEGEENSLIRHCSSVDLSKVCVCERMCLCVGQKTVESEWTLGHSPLLLPNTKLRTLVLVLVTF